MAPDDDDLDEPPFRMPPPPDDRLWRHPSELAPEAPRRHRGALARALMTVARVRRG